MMSQLAAMVASTANFLLLARIVGPESYGLIAATWALVLGVAPLALLGSDRLIVRDVTASTDSDLLRTSLGAGLLTTVAGGALMVLALSALHAVLLPQVPLALLLALGLADIIALGTTNCLTSLCFAARDARAGSLLSVSTSTTRVLVVVVFSLGGTADPVRWGVTYACLSGVAALVQTLWAVRRFGRPSLAGYRAIRRARDGLPYSADAVVAIIRNDADKFLLVRAGFVVEAGVYSIAYRLSSIAYLPALAVLQASFPRFFALGAQGGLPATAAHANKLVRPLAAYGLLAAVALVSAAPLIPRLVGEAYRDAVPLLMLLAPLTLFKVVQSVLGDALTGAGRQPTRTACMAIAASVNVALNVALIPSFGLRGALTATFVAEALLVLVYVAALQRGLRAADDVPAARRS